MIKRFHTLFVIPVVFCAIACIRKNANDDLLSKGSQGNSKIAVLSLSSQNKNQTFTYSDSPSSKLSLKGSAHTQQIYLAIPLEQVKLPAQVEEKFVDSGFVTLVIDGNSSFIRGEPLGLTARFFSDINWRYSRQLSLDPRGPGIIPSQYVNTRGVLSGEAPVFRSNNFNDGFEYQVVQDIHRYNLWLENSSSRYREQVSYVAQGQENVLNFRGRVFRQLPDELKSRMNHDVLNDRISVAMHYSTQTFDADLATILLPEFSRRVRVSEGEAWRQARRHPENMVTFTVEGDFLKVKRTVVYEHFSTNNEEFLGNLGYANREFSINLRTGDISPEEASIVWKNLAREERKRAFYALLFLGSPFVLAAGIIHREDIKKLIEKNTQKANDAPKPGTEIDDYFEASPVELEVKENTKGAIVGTSGQFDAGSIEIKSGTYQSIQYLPKSSPN